MSRSGRAALLAGIAMLGGTGPVRADDLRGALTMAYNTSPTLEAARAQQRAVDAGVPIAKAPGLPSLSGVASYTEYVKQAGPVTPTTTVTAASSSRACGR